MISSSTMAWVILIAVASGIQHAADKGAELLILCVVYLGSWWIVRNAWNRWNLVNWTNTQLVKVEFEYMDYYLKCDLREWYTTKTLQLKKALNNDLEKVIFARDRCIDMTLVLCGVTVETSMTTQCQCIVIHVTLVTCLVTMSIMRWVEMDTVFLEWCVVLVWTAVTLAMRANAEEEDDQVKDAKEMIQDWFTRDRGDLHQTERWCPEWAVAHAKRQGEVDAGVLLAQRAKEARARYADAKAKSLTRM